MHELREKDKAELEGLLTEHRKQLATLRVEQISGGNQSKLSKIREVRKAIARIETVIHQETLHQVRKKYAGKARAHRPRDLRQKKTRAIRLAMTPAETYVKSKRAVLKINHFPQRRFAVKA